MIKKQCAMDVVAHAILQNFPDRIEMLCATLAGKSEITSETATILDVYNSLLQRLEWANRMASIASEVLDMDLTELRMQNSHEARQLQGLDDEQWKHAFDSEMNSMQDNDVCKLFMLRKGKRAIGSRIFINRKRADKYGKMAHTVWLIARGYSQVASWITI